MSDTVPCQTPLRSNGAGEVPEVVARRAFEVYDSRGYNQDFETLHARGGFSTRELIAQLYARTFPRDEWRRREDEVAGLIKI